MYATITPHYRVNFIWNIQNRDQEEACLLTVPRNNTVWKWEPRLTITFPSQFWKSWLHYIYRIFQKYYEENHKFQSNMKYDDKDRQNSRALKKSGCLPIKRERLRPVYKGNRRSSLRKVASCSFLKAVTYSNSHLPTFLFTPTQHTYHITGEKVSILKRQLNMLKSTLSL